MEMGRMKRDKEGRLEKVGAGGCRDCCHSIGIGAVFKKRAHSLAPIFVFIVLI